MNEAAKRFEILRSAGLSPAGEFPFVRSLDDSPFPGQESVWVDDALQVAAVNSEEGVEVAWLDVAWPRPDMPANYLRQLTRVRTRDEGLEAAVGESLHAARRRRGKALRRCRFCGERHLPGHMESRDVCQGCAEGRLGHVY